jgi:hypothetical protein
MPEEPTRCLECHELIRKGRSDKKFCNSTCKDKYYNRLKLEARKEIGRIDTVLKRNRKILKQVFNPQKEDGLITRETLLKAGFEFEFHTHHVITKIRSNEFIFCYDYGYREVEKDKYKVIKRFD